MATATPTRGFSLPELMAVVGVIGVLAAVGIGHFLPNLRGEAASGLSREVYTRLAQARFTAVSSGARVRVRLQTGRVTPVAQVQPALSPGLSPQPDDGFAPAGEEVPGMQGAQLVTVAPTVDLAGAPPAPGNASVDLIFYPDGRAQIDGLPPHPGATLYFADDRQGHPYRVTVLGRTGLARVLDH